MTQVGGGAPGRTGTTGAASAATTPATTPATAASALDRWPFVGRHDELARALASVTADPAGGVVISARAGEGKTRLADELLAAVAAQGHPTATAVATATAAAVPLGALAHLLPPEVLLAEAGAPGAPVDPVRLLARARQALAPASGRLVLMVDDAHLLDAVSLTLLSQLVHDGSAALVLSVRAGEPEPDALEALWRSERLARLELGPLSDDAMDALLHLALGGPVQGRAAFELRRASGGNLLFLRELVRAALNAGVLERLEGVWHLTGPLPAARRIGELLGARLVGLDDERRSALELLAVAGPLPLPQAMAATAPGVLEGLEADGFVELFATDRPNRPEMLRISHPLLAEAVRQEVPTLRRRSLLVGHADRVAGSPDAGPDDALMVATWRLEAGVAVEPDLLEVGARLARYANDFPAAARLAAEAFAARPTREAAILMAESYYELGRWAECEEACAAGMAVPGTLEQDIQLAGIRSPNLLFGLLRPDDAIAVMRDALAAVDEQFDGSLEHQALRAESVSRLGNTVMYGGDPAEALRLLGDRPGGDADGPAGDLPPEIERARMRVRVLWAIPGAPATTFAGRTATAIDLARQAYADHVQLGGQLSLSGPEVHLLTLCVALQEHGSFDEAEELARGGYDFCVEARLPLGHTWFSLCLARQCIRRGHAASGVRWFREALSASTALGWLGTRSMALAGVAATSALGGDVVTAREALAADEIPGRFGFMEPESAIGPAWLALAEGRAADARSVLLDAAERARMTGHHTSEAWLVHEAARTAPPAELPVLAARLADLAAVGESELTAARAAHVGALAADDADGLAAAGETLATIGCDLLAAEAFAAAADLVRAAGDQRAANRLAARSAECLDACEGARSARVAPAAASVVPLTAREREVAVLAAAGVQSKEIADRLYLSVRTVNNHLQNAYTKLGVSSRAELAAVLDAG